MGILSWFRRGLSSTAPNGQPVQYQHFGGSDVDVLGMSAEDLWRTQPYLRMVVTFLARNVAQLGVHSFVRVSDTDRKRVTDSPLPRLLAHPNTRNTTYELIYSLVADLALYDEAFWLLQASDAPSGWSLTPIPPSWIRARGGATAFAVDWYDVLPPNGQKAKRVKAEDMLVFRGWNPDDPSYGSSPVHALKQILAEQIHAHNYRNQVWERGGRVGSVLTRPPTAPTWSPEARDRFRADWRDRWAGDQGSDAGGTPILEDGMTLEKVRFSAHEEEWVEAAKLSLTIVAAAYHVNPTMVGVLDNANYSNVREFRRMLYGDTLGPIMAMIEARINAFLAPRIEPDSGVYVEFNMAEKLKGSFEEQAAVMQTMVGAPIMTRDEGRARFNLPSIGADELVTPLNVLIGGQASPRDSGSQNETGKGRAPLVKSGPTQPQQDKVAEVLAAFFDRQGRRVLSNLGVNAADWWDADRWDAELASDLHPLAVTLAGIIGADVAERLGFDASDYSADQTVTFLRAVAERYARNINLTTKGQLDDAIADPDKEPAHVFDVAKESRSEQAGALIGTFLAGFATREAAQQITYNHGVRWVKVWNTGRNARSTHARMNGETVPVEEPFSNGMNWPGDSSDADEVAGCNCSVSIERAPEEG